MRDLLFTKAASAALANRLSFCPRIPRRAFSPARSGISRHIFSAQRCSTWGKNQERKEECSTWNIKEERVAEGVNVPRGTMSGKKEKNQLKCKAKKKNRPETAKKIPPEKAVFLSDEGRCTNGAKNEAYQNCRFPRRGKSRMAGQQQDYSGRKDYSSTTVVQPYLSSQRPYWISCNLL